MLCHCRPSLGGFKPNTTVLLRANMFDLRLLQNIYCINFDTLLDFEHIAIQLNF